MEWLDLETFQVKLKVNGPRQPVRGGIQAMTRPAQPARKLFVHLALQSLQKHFRYLCQRGWRHPKAFSHTI